MTDELLKQNIAKLIDDRISDLQEQGKLDENRYYFESDLALILGVSEEFLDKYLCFTTYYFNQQCEIDEEQRAWNEYECEIEE